MNNKQELIDQANKLQKELDILKLKINNPKDIFNIICYEDVLKQLNEKRETCPYKVIKQIEKYFNQGWIPNFSNSDQKWYPWFFERFDGLIFHCSSYCHDCFYGLPAHYKTKEISDHIGKYFVKEYENLKNNY